MVSLIFSNWSKIMYLYIAFFYLMIRFPMHMDFISFVLFYSFNRRSFSLFLCYWFSYAHMKFINHHNYVYIYAHHFVKSHEWGITKHYDLCRLFISSCVYFVIWLNKGSFCNEHDKSNKWMTFAKTESWSFSYFKDVFLRSAHLTKTELVHKYGDDKETMKSKQCLVFSVQILQLQLQ